MSLVRTAILNALVTEIEGITAVNKATRFTMSLDSAQKENPYVGVVAGREISLVEDATDIKFELIVSLFIITEEQYENIEGLLDDIKEVIHGTTSPINLHADIDLITVIDVYPVHIDDLDELEGRYSSNQIDIRILYNAPRSTF